jgi:hypothetical protein
VLVAPELAGGAESCARCISDLGPLHTFADTRHTCLDLVHNHSDVVLLGNVTKTLEESRRSVVIASLALNGLHDKTSDGELPIKNC